MRIKKGNIKWGRFLMAFFVGFSAAVGVLCGKLAKAFEGEYWTTTYDGLSITVVSVEQNGISLAPIAGGEDSFYFEVVNNTDPVRVGARAEGMVQGETYYYYPTSSWREDDRINLSYEDNGIIIYEELTPVISFGDAYYLSGVYHVGASVNRENGYGVQKNIIVHPTSIGSHSIDIISVKQGDAVLSLTNNEYQITDYNTPVTLTYKFKNLEAGKSYSAGIGNNDWYQFRAEGTQTAETIRELTLDLINSHIKTYVYLQNSDVNERVELFFKVADSDFNQLGDIFIDEIEQGGVALVAEADTSGWQRQYTFDANDAQSLTVRMHTTRATADMNYYVMFNMSGYNYGGGYSSEEPLMVTGEELEQEAGVVLTIPAPYGLSESSPLALSFVISTTGVDTHDYDSARKVVYKNYATPQNGNDIFKINVRVNEDVPRYEAGMFYSDGTRIESDKISPALHDSEHPLILEVKGERYDDATTYNIDTKVMVSGETEPYYTHSFTATGAELNEGTVFTLTGLSLELPEFDPSGETSGYELYYVFSLSIDGLRQSGEMSYVYDGWLRSSMTFNDGSVVALGGGGGIGGDVYTTMNEVTMRKSSLDASKGAALHYFAGEFDESLSYDYTIYYNSDAGEEWWSAPTGNVIESGTMPGSYLNSDGFSVDLTVPSNESESVLYTLVISRNGGIVKIAKDFIAFTSDPKIESFKFTADSDSFMQTDRTGYRVAKNTDIQATLIGDGFDNAEEYKLWVTYAGYHYSEGQSEYSYPEYVDLSSLNESVVVTGAQLNAGYTYTLEYVEALDNINFVEIGFAVSDLDAEAPSWYGQSGNGYYPGHEIHIDYVNDDEVFRDYGYQVNEDGTITDVSQPDEHHDEIPVDDRTPGDVNVTVEGGTITVVSEKPVVVVGFRNDEWVVLYGWDEEIDGEERTYHYSIGDCNEAKVVLKGDGDMDGAVTPADLNILNRSLISLTLGNRYRALTELEETIYDFDRDGSVTPADLNTLNRALISPTLAPRYQKIQW